jgi:hypothetical protein
MATRQNQFLRGNELMPFGRLKQPVERFANLGNLN